MIDAVERRPLNRKRAACGLCVWLLALAPAPAWPDDYPTARTAVRVVQDTAAPAPKTSEQVASAPASYQTVTVSAERDGVGHRIVASNQGSVSVSVMVALKNRENVHSDASWPVFEVVPPRSTVTVGKIRPGSEPAQYSFRVAYRTVFLSLIHI